MLLQSMVQLIFVLVKILYFSTMLMQFLKTFLSLQDRRNHNFMAIILRDLKSKKRHDLLVFFLKSFINFFRFTFLIENLA
jgi:hypothetical protein